MARPRRLLMVLALGSSLALAPPVWGAEPRDPEWSRQAVFYQIFVRSFACGNGDGIGDLAGVTARLDYLKELGVGAIWLMPIHPSPSYHGYNITDYKAVHPDFGTLADFDVLVATAHRKGIRVILDWVVNHTSASHPWFQGDLAGDPRYVDYYRWGENAPNGSWGRQADGRYAFYTFGPQSDMPDLDYQNPKLRADILDAAQFWLKRGVDGFRLDVAQAIGDGDLELTLDWWREFRASVLKTNPQAFIVGEVNYDKPGDLPKIAPYYGVMNSTFDFPLYNLITLFARGVENDLVKALNQAREQYGAEQAGALPSLLVGNHDRQRIASFLQFDPARMRRAMTLLFTLPGRPFLYYGDEIGQRGGHAGQGDPLKREPMDWYAKASGPLQARMDPKTYASPALNLKPHDGISVEEQAKDPASLLSWVKRLIAIRQANPVLREGSLLRLGAPEGVFAWQAVPAPGSGMAGKGLVTVILNQDAAASKRLKLGLAGTELLSGRTYRAGETLELPALGNAIFSHQAAGSPFGDWPVVDQVHAPCTVTFRVRVPADTPADAVLWMPNSTDSWDAGTVTANPELKLKKTGPGLYEITITRLGGNRMEYKFFRGGWNTSETHADGNWNGNREYLFIEPKETVDATIDGWRDINYHEE